MIKSNPKDPNEKRLACIVNPYSANKKWKRNLLLRNYLYKNIPGQIIDNPEGKEDTIKLAKKLSEENDILIVAGGDGTIADVIQGIVRAGKEKDVVLGIIPLGSGNAFCKSMGIPKSVRKSLQIIREGYTKEIDLIDIDGTAATFASIGATAKVTEEKMRHKISGLLGHFLAARILLKTPLLEQKIDLIDGIDDGGNRFDRLILDLKVFDSVIGKTKYFGYGWKIAPLAEVDDGYVDITFFETSSTKYILFFPSIYFGAYQKTQKHYKAKKIIIRGKNLSVQYHGEVLGQKDRIEMTILPRALKVIAPRETPVSLHN